MEMYQGRLTTAKKSFHHVLNFIRILMTEVFGSIERVTKWFGEDLNVLGSHVPNNFAFIKDIKSDSNASVYKHIVDDWMLHMPAHANGQGSWILSNHDRSRVSSRFGANRYESMAIISMTLPGVTLVYYVST
jgi:alpha-glucosidase